MPENTYPPEPEHQDEGYKAKAMLARSCLGGKKTTSIKAACSDEFKELVTRHLQLMRADTGRTVSESEFVEKCVAIAILGWDHVQSVELEQQKRLVGSWANLGQKLAGL